MTELVRLIEEEIDKHKWSLREAEEKLKLSRSTLSKLLTGKTHFPDLTTFEKLATYFGLHLWYSTYIKNIGISG